MATDPTELTGKVVDGVVVFENGGALPDGTIVRVEPLEESKSSESSHDVPHDIQRLREMLLSFAGVINDPDLPTDLSDNPKSIFIGNPKKNTPLLPYPRYGGAPPLAGGKGPPPPPIVGTKKFIPLLAARPPPTAAPSPPPKPPSRGETGVLYPTPPKTNRREAEYQRKKVAEKKRKFA